MLLAVAFTDELASGVVPAGSPELAGSFGLAASRAAGWTLVAFQLLAFLIEPPLLALAHGRRARTLRTLGLWGMALASLVAALSPSYPVLLVALMLYGPASGLGVNLAQASVVAGSPGRTESALARWMLLGLLGDLAAPAVLAASVALGLGWRGALVAAAGLAAVQASAAMRVPGAADEEEPAAAGTLREALSALRSCPPLLGWSLALTLCGLMDEVLVSFGALWLAGNLHADATRRAVVLGAWVAGGAIGSALLERLAGRFRPSALLRLSALGCAAAYLAWLAAPNWVASAAAFGAAGAFAAWQYPLLRARAFALLPGRPNVVLAVGSTLTGVELAIPLVLGGIADRAGLTAAMVVLLLQPAGALAAAVVARRGGG